jgi:hypothetical protein
VYAICGRKVPERNPEELTVAPRGAKSDDLMPAPLGGATAAAPLEDPGPGPLGPGPSGNGRIV